MSVGVSAVAAIMGLALLGGCELILDFSPLGDAASGQSDAGAVDAASCSNAYEPNGSIEMASAIEAGPLDAASCPAPDEDFYSFAVDGTEDVEILVTFEAGEDDLDLELYKPASESEPAVRLEISSDGDGDERIVRSAAEVDRLVAGTYIIRVFGRTETVENAYQLRLTKGVLPAAAP
jgi:hypothetical protein